MSARLPSVSRSIMALAVLTAAVGAQHAGDPEEFLRLEPVLQRAIATAAPFVVTVETFGGTRRNLGKAGPMDSDAPPKPRVRPKPEP